MNEMKLEENRNNEVSQKTLKILWSVRKDVYWFFRI